MTFSTPWLGTKRVAFVPLSRTNATPPDVIPPDWENVILRRVLNDPRPDAGGVVVDRSLRAWVRAVSWGQADIDPVMLERQAIDQQNVEPGDLADRPQVKSELDALDPPAQSAILIMLGGLGAGKTSGFWSRVVMVETNGTWLHEIIHALTNFADLYDHGDDLDPTNRKIGLYDIMSSSLQAHPTAFTKNELGWLDTHKIGLYEPGDISTFTTLQPISANPPAELGELFAVRIGDDVPYVMVEARQKTDHFEAGISASGGEMGILSEGVIAYRVQTRNPTVQQREGCRKPLFLMTLIPLQPGESVMLDSGVKLEVHQRVPKGFIIQLTTETFQPEPIVQVTVPSVIGTKHKPAEQVMVAAGLCPRFSGPLANSEVKSQSPEGGEVVEWGTTVKIVMVTNIVIVPNVIGLNHLRARVKIENARLRVSFFGPSTGAEEVDYQFPQSGEVVEWGTVVKCSMVPARLVVVPSVIGTDSRTARRAIAHAELVAMFSGPLTNSEVQSQSPEGGDDAPRGTVVRCRMIRIEPEPEGPTE